MLNASFVLVLFIRAFAAINLIALLGCLNALRVLPSDKTALFVAISLVYSVIVYMLWELSCVLRDSQTAAFTQKNAQRLTRMAWLCLIWQALHVGLAFSGETVNLISTPSMVLRTIEANSLPVGGLILTMSLFAVAQIFRDGAAMREDLEGTV